MPYKVLIVDDEPDVLLLCKVNLEFEGYSVIEARNGVEALDKVKEHNPDLVLLDIMMPDLDGWQVLSLLKDDPATAQIPVVMLTAKVQERDQIRGWSEGAADYVTKPFNPIALSRTVRNALQPPSPEDTERRRRQVLEKLRLSQSL
jgi:DNA-binding response OmpR family regulator